jgi:hypothetical protein
MAEGVGTEPARVMGAPAAGELDMHRRRGRTVGTLIIGAIVAAAVAYTAFAGSHPRPMPSPYVIGAIEPLP